jgi:hypothetical protein
MTPDLRIACDDPPRVPIDALTAYAHVVEVRRSMEFYRLLGPEARAATSRKGSSCGLFLRGTPATRGRG